MKNSQPPKRSLGSQPETGQPETGHLPEFTLFNVEQAIAPLLTGDFPSRWDHAKHFAKQFAHWGDRPIPHLIHHLHSSDNAESQWFLIRTLGQFEHPSVVEALANFLVGTAADDLQIEATRALTALGSSAIATLTDLLISPEVETRRLAVITLAKIRRSAVIEPLLSVASDPDELIRSTALEALGSFHDPRITPILFRALHDQPAIAVEAARTLGRRSDLLSAPEIITELQGSLLSHESAVARESAIALGRLGAHPGGALATEALGKFLTQPAPSKVKVAAVRALGWIEAPAATAYLAAAFDYPFPLVMPEVKQEIARSLGQTRSAPLQRAAAQPLIHWLRSQANPQLDSQTDPPFSPDTFALKQIVLSALARLGATDTTDSIDSLIPLLGDPDTRIRMHALNALKQIDPILAQRKIEHYLSSEAISLALKKKVADSLNAW